MTAGAGKLANQLSSLTLSTILYFREILGFTIELLVGLKSLPRPFSLTYGMLSEHTPMVASLCVGISSDSPYLAKTSVILNKNSILMALMPSFNHCSS